MQELFLTEGLLDGFVEALRADDRSRNTQEKYRRDLAALMAWLDGRPVTKDVLVEYKHRLVESGKAPSSVNSTLSAINKLLEYAGHPEMKAGFLKIQRRVFRDEGRELTRKDYDRFVETAYGLGKTRLGLVLETMGSTGVRISELHYITVDGLSEGQVDIDLKNKVRTVMLPRRLCEKLKSYCRERGIASGEVFRTRSGGTLSRQEIWREMKELCAKAGVAESKVYPHNFRHMFAVVFYQSCKDIVKLADVLGHSSINTTRIYLISSGKEHARQLERLGLVR